VKNALNNMLKRAGQVTAGALPAAVLAGLGLPALGALVFLAVLMLGVICWIINSEDRSARVTRMILARHGHQMFVSDIAGTVSGPLRQRACAPRRATPDGR
jgi:hypothetical protein